MNYMNEILNRLADLIIAELDKRNISCLVFSELCGIAKNQIGEIVNRQKKDIKLSTIVKICENSDIQIEDIFCEKSNEIPLKNAFMIISGKEYKIELKEYK